MNDVPISPDELKKMKSMIVEMTNCLEKMDAEREQIKAIAEACEEKFGVKKKMINKVARTMYKHNYSDLQTENSHFEFLYETMFEGKKVEDNE